eukprot:CAMPEP_0172867490 /NCGR_PEP_ID=MMETSP1075-20121228/83803_1 /TAXON_ID=2916 /ORGANISM="Ceratium fusus, Strain PA161109" /LENGTH=60 /DNA_ID=CAMNT_0013716869 /DNA_START=130 /DNA_END=313 /DNA_ORIENTATION=-
MNEDTTLIALRDAHVLVKVEKVQPTTLALRGSGSAGKPPKHKFASTMSQEMRAGCVEVDL